MSASARQMVVRPSVETAPGGKKLYYNNVGLFSDPFLDQLSDSKKAQSPFVLRSWETEGLSEFSATYEWMLDTWGQLKDVLPNKSEAQLEALWIRPILKLLGWEYEVQSRLEKWGKTEIPDYALFSSRQTYLKAQNCKTDDAYFEHVAAVADAKQMGVCLDGSKLDKSNPSYQITWYMQITGKEWGILTDGRYWRLYSTRARTKYSVYYEVNVEKFLYERDDRLFKYFFNFFRKEAFVKQPNSGQCFLDVVFESGERYAKEVETKLKDRAFHLVELICQGFANGKTDLEPSALNRIYQHSLFYLFRLMFILNCEAKGLLNVHKQCDYYTSSLRALCHRVKEQFVNGQSWSRRNLSYNHIAELFELLKNGDDRIGIHGFGAEVFSSGDSQFYRDNPISDEVLNKVLLELAFAQNKKDEELSFIDYKRLSADHLGSIFEGLLEYRLEAPKVTSTVRPVLVSGSEDRKATGSYYTPQYVVDYIVRETLLPLIKDKSVTDILALKVVDPAMGSGHFLLGAIRFLEDAILSRLSEETISVIDPQEVRWKVLHSCIHGVDINPLAVELAKFSLWIATARPGFQLEPLADQLAPADSLLQDSVWTKTFGNVAKNGGFDAVIGNPPYVRQEYLSSQKQHFEAKFDVFHGMTDLYAYFIEKGISVLKPRGRFGMIVSNKWMRTEYGKPLRSWLRSKGLELLVDFGDLPVFPGVAAYPVIVFVDKNCQRKTVTFAPVSNLSDEISKQVKQARFSVSLTDLSDAAWTVVRPEKQKLIAKLSKNSVSLAEYIGASAFRGILTGCNEAFVVSEAEAKALIKADPKNREIIKPFAAGKDIHRYGEVTSPKYIILALRGIDIDRYPAVKKHLAKFKERLTPKPKGWKGDWPGRKAGSYKWYELQDAIDYIEKFAKPKISFLVFQVKPAFTLDLNGMYSNNAVWSFGSTDKYLLALLNSKLGWFLISQSCTQIQGGFQLIWKNLCKMPIRKPTSLSSENRDVLKRIEHLVDKAMQTSQMGRKTVHQQTDVELEIDQILYQLFDLSKNEIAILENFWNQNSKEKGRARTTTEEDALAA